MVDASHAMGEPLPLEGGSVRTVCAACGGRRDTRAEGRRTLDAVDLRLERRCGESVDVSVPVPEGKGLMGYHQPGTRGWPFGELVVVIPGEQALHNEEAA